MPERKIFHCVGVVIAEIQSDTMYSLLAVPENHAAIDFSDESLRFPVELTRTPNRTANWDKVQCDDRGIDANGKELPVSRVHDKHSLPVTGIGTGSQDRPMDGALIGGVYLERTRYQTLQPNHFPWEKPEVQLTSIVKRVAELDVTLTRYHGFLATVKAMTDTHVTLKFDEPNAAVTKKYKKEHILWLEPNDDALCGQDPIAPDSPVDHHGAIFIDMQTAASNLKSPKVPKGTETAASNPEDDERPKGTET